jgi:hypothetical protein
MSRQSSAMSSRIAFLTEMAVDAKKTGETLFYVRIPGNIHPLERESRFEEPLDAALKKTGVGEVAGGGEQMGSGNEVVYCGLDVYVKDRETGFQFLRQALRSLPVPDETVIEEFLPQWRQHEL